MLNITIEHNQRIDKLGKDNQLNNKIRDKMIEKFYKKFFSYLFYKEIEIIILDIPEISNKIVVLFDSGAQETCISKKLAKSLNLEDIDYRGSSWFRNPQTSFFAKIWIKIWIWI